MTITIISSLLVFLPCYFIMLMFILSFPRQIETVAVDKMVEFTNFNEVIVISDIDDTIEMSNVESMPENVLNHFWRGVKPFQRLIDIYRHMERYHNGKKEKISFYYVTAAPYLLELVVNQERWLIDHGAPAGTIRQKRLFELGKKTKEYKFTIIKNILKKKLEKAGGRKNFEIYLFGDNGEYDPEVYKMIQEDWDLREFKIRSYIRRVNDNKVEIARNNYFVSEFDLIEQVPFSKMLSDDLKSTIAREFWAGKLIPEFVKKSINTIPSARSAFSSRVNRSKIVG